MKATEVRQMTDAELVKAVEDAKKELFNLRFQWEIGQLESYTRIREVKKDVARLKTIQRERQLAVELIQQEDGADA